MADSCRAAHVTIIARDLVITITIPTPAQPQVALPVVVHAYDRCTGKVVPAVGIGWYGHADGAHPRGSKGGVS